MIFQPKNKNISHDNFDIYIQNSKIPLVKSTRFLGVVIDDKLTWKDHINYIACKVSKSIGAINRLKKSIPLNILLMIYQSIVLPYFNYCNILWGNCAIVHLNRIIVLQKRAVRVITNSSPRSSSQSLFIKN